MATYKLYNFFMKLSMNIIPPNLSVILLRIFPEPSQLFSKTKPIILYNKFTLSLVEKSFAGWTYTYIQEDWFQSTCVECHEKNIDRDGIA